MNKERVAKMADSIVAEERVEVGPQDDEALANVDQAFDLILASVRVIDENLPRVKTDGVPQKAAVDAVADLMETAIKPYLADALQAMQAFEGGEKK
jgi:hypothetical protein